MILTIDIGNSNIVLGGVEDTNIRFEARLRTDATKTSDEYAVDLKMLLDIYAVDPKAIEGHHHFQRGAAGAEFSADRREEAHGQDQSGGGSGAENRSEHPAGKPRTDGRRPGGRRRGGPAGSMSRR